MACTEVVLCRNVRRARHSLNRIVATAMSTSVAKVYSHFKVSNGYKVAIFYGIVLIPIVCCSFRCTLSLLLTMRLCAQRNSCPKRTEWSDTLQTNTYLHTHPNKVHRRQSCDLKFIYRLQNFNVLSEVYLSTSPVTSKDRRGLVNILKNKPGWLVNIIKHVCGVTY